MELLLNNDFAKHRYCRILNINICCSLLGASIERAKQSVHISHRVSKNLKFIENATNKRKPFIKVIRHFYLKRLWKQFARRIIKIHRKITVTYISRDNQICHINTREGPPLAKLKATIPMFVFQLSNGINLNLVFIIHILSLVKRAVLLCVDNLMTLQYILECEIIISTGVYIQEWKIWEVTKTKSCENKTSDVDKYGRNGNFFKDHYDQFGRLSENSAASELIAVGKMLR